MILQFINIDDYLKNKPFISLFVIFQKKKQNHTMKKLVFTAAILISCFSFKLADAQIHISLGLNINNQPAWGPVGYDHAEFYYMPDIGVYYNVVMHKYIYFDRGVWVHANALPPRYANFDLYHGYKVVINERKPWLNDRVYRVKYAGFRGRRDQVVIRDSRDAKYRNHWSGR